MLDDNEKVEEFDAENEVDFSYAVEGLGRFRVNAFLQRGSISIVMRAIPVIIKAVDELGLPESSRSSPRRSAASCCSPAPPARASRPRSRP